MPYMIDITGQRFDRLVALSIARRNTGSGVYWNCICDCGNIAVALGKRLRAGLKRSCGCLQKEIAAKNAKLSNAKAVEASRTANLIHGHTKYARNTYTYNSWISMKDRCYNSNANGFKHWGGRGITVCQRWLDSFQNFLDDLGERPKGKTLDRINVNGNYEPSNCRWATAQEQTDNRRPCMTADNIPDEEIIKQFHKRFPEVNIDILAERHSVLLQKRVEDSTI